MARSGTDGTAPAPTPIAPRSGAPRTADVLVVGAGPTGLMAAGDLAEAGHRVTLVERRDETISNLTRALVVHARTLEQLDARGLADELITTGARMESLVLFGRATLRPGTLPGRFPFALITPQFEVERLLERRARKAGVTFLYGTEVRELRQDRDGVEVDVTEARGGRHETDGPARTDGPATTTGPATTEDRNTTDDRRAADGRGTTGTPATTTGPAQVRTLRASYLIGTDGVHSSIRRLLGLPFPGRSVIRSIVLADVRLSDPPDTPFLVNAKAGAFALVASFGGGWYRVMGFNRRRPPRDGGTGRANAGSGPPDLEEVRELAVEALGTDHGMHDPRWTSRFHSDERQAPRYSVGRVFLAGDAAHVHSPAGGMGMNTGLQDAANLTWKISAVLRGHSPATLLETYQSERHPVGTQVLRMSGAIIRLALAHSAAGRALRSVGAEILNRVRPLTNRAVRMVSGIGISYAPPRGSHPLAGRRAPDLPLTSGRLYEALRKGPFVLVSPLDGPAPDTSEEADDRTVHVRSAAVGGRTLLVRPDGYIAWAGAREDRQGMRQALAEWTGSPAVRTAA